MNYKNIREAQLHFADKLNCFVGLNGQGKTNILDSIYLLSFTKSAYNAIDSLNITHTEPMAMVQGLYATEPEPLQVTCGLKRGQKKQFRLGKTDYKRLTDHIGLLPLVMVSPQDGALIEDGSDERRRFMDVVISQKDRTYLEHLTTYNALLKQRNALLKQYADAEAVPWELFEVLELQMLSPAHYIHSARQTFIDSFLPLFESLYGEIAGSSETVSLGYTSQLQDRDLQEAFVRTRSRDLILGWTSQGIHKDDLTMQLDAHPLKQVGSQGQQKTFLLSMKLAQALYLGKPILLLDDIFDKLDSERVERIVRLVNSDRFGQIFITDTDRQHLTDLLRPTPSARLFHVTHGTIQSL